MDTVVSKLTVLFENPFWIGLYERESDGNYEICKITFGAEPKDYEVYSFLLHHWESLLFSPGMKLAAVGQKRINPKRMRRIIHQQLQHNPIGTKAQQALKLQQEQVKQVRKTRLKVQKEAVKAKKFQLRKTKRKEKHKGH